MFTITTVNSSCPDAIYASIKEHLLIKLTCNFQSSEAFVMFAQRLGDLYKWSFGVVNELKLNHQTANYLYSEEEVPLHWDGAFAQSPHLLLFHCVEAAQDEEGGETLFVNSQALYNSFSDREKQVLETMTFSYDTEKLSHYGGSIEQKVIDFHPYTQQRVLRFAENVHSNKNPVYRRLKNASNEQIAMTNVLEDRLYSPKFCYSHRSCTDKMFGNNTHLRQAAEMGNLHFVEALMAHEDIEIKKNLKGNFPKDLAGKYPLVIDAFERYLKNPVDFKR